MPFGMDLKSAAGQVRPDVALDPYQIDATAGPTSTSLILTNYSNAPIVVTLATYDARIVVPASPVTIPPLTGPVRIPVSVDPSRPATQGASLGVFVSIQPFDFYVFIPVLAHYVPPPQLKVAPTSIAFDVTLGSQPPPPQKVTVINIGDSPVTLGSIDGRYVSVPDAVGSLAPGASQIVTVSLDPTKLPAESGVSAVDGVQISALNDIAQMASYQISIGISQMAPVYTGPSMDADVKSLDIHRASYDQPFPVEPVTVRNLRPDRSIIVYLTGNTGSVQPSPAQATIPVGSQATFHVGIDPKLLYRPTQVLKILAENEMISIPITVSEDIDAPIVSQGPTLIDGVPEDVYQARLVLQKQMQVPASQAVIPMAP